MSYITADDLYVEFGRTNVRSWGDPNGKGVAVDIDAKITACISEAEGMFDERMRQGIYVIPLTPAIPHTVKYIIKGLALELLYAHRRIGDEEDRMGPRIEDAKRLFAQVIQGAFKLSCTKKSYSHTIPWIMPHENKSNTFSP